MATVVCPNTITRFTHYLAIQSLPVTYLVQLHYHLLFPHVPEIILGLRFLKYEAGFQNHGVVTPVDDNGC